MTPFMEVGNGAAVRLFSERAYVALAACAYETDTPLNDWIEWACWVRFNAKTMRP